MLIFLVLFFMLKCRPGLHTVVIDDDDGFILLSRFIYSWKTYSGNHSVFLDEIMKELKMMT
jgi:hypothetical protein